MILNKIDKVLLLGLVVLTGRGLFAADGFGKFRASGSSAFYRIEPWSPRKFNAQVVDEKTPNNGWAAKLPEVDSAVVVDQIKSRSKNGSAKRSVPVMMVNSRVDLSKPTTTWTCKHPGCSYTKAVCVSDNRDIRQHNLAHLPERYFKCLVEGCESKPFQTPGALRVHISRHHGSVKGMNRGCLFCPDFKTDSEAALVRHVEKKHMGSGQSGVVVNQPAPAVSEYDDVDVEIIG